MLLLKVNYDFLFIELLLKIVRITKNIKVLKKQTKNQIFIYSSHTTDFYKTNYPIESVDLKFKNTIF